MLQPGVQERFRVKGLGLRGLGVQGFRGLGFRVLRFRKFLCFSGRFRGVRAWSLGLWRFES